MLHIVFIKVSPLMQAINTSYCTNITFQLYLTDLTNLELFKLHPVNPCQNLIDALILSIHVLPCPVGFDFSRTESACDCTKKLKKLAHKCYIDSNLSQLNE